MRRFFLIIGISIVSQVAVAQWRFTPSLNASGCGNSLDDKIAWRAAEAQVNNWLNQGINFRSKVECEQSRQVVMGYSNNYGNCKIRFIASPCVGSGGTMGNVDVLGVSKGSSFNSTNPVNEINDWSNDDMERMLALNKDFQSFEPTNVATGDPTFDVALNKLSGRMPDGSTSFIIRDNQTSSLYRPSHSGILVPDDFTSRPFDYGLGENSSSDLKSVNINLSPAESYSGEISQANNYIDAIRSLDERLDWYNAINRGEGNVFQYMYTRWGKENVMAGVDWWERNQIGDRISNAYATVKETIANTIDHPMDAYDNVRNATIGIMKENIDDGIKSTVQFMLPPQYQNSGERVQGIYDAEKGTITDVFGIIKKAPDMISKGETFDTDAVLSKERDRYMGLAASYGSPTTSKAYAHLKSASDIYNMPKEQQRKGLAKWLGKEAKKEAKKEFENSRYGEKWNSIKKKAKSIINPYNIIDD